MRPRFLERFEHVRVAGDGWRATCPACDKRDSLSIGEGRDRYVVNFFCHCPAKEALEHVGLRFDDLLYQAEARGEYTSPVHGPQASPLTPLVTPAPESEVEALLRQHDEGVIEPVPVELPPLPPGAPEPMRRVMEFFRRVHGLRLAVCDEREVLFGAEWVAGKLGYSEPSVRRILGRLVDDGVLVDAGRMPDCGERRGTRKFAPGQTNVVPLRRRGAAS